MRNVEAERKACDVRLRAGRRVGELLKELQRATPQTANRAGANQHSSSATVAAERTPYRAAIDANGISERSSRRYQQLADVPAPVFEEALNRAAGRAAAPDRHLGTTTRRDQTTFAVPGTARIPLL